MATMDGHLYQPQHYLGFNDNRYQSYPQQGHQYPVDLGQYSTGSSHISLDYDQDSGYDMHSATQPRTQSYNGHTLQVTTESHGHHEHDPADYTAHPSRPQYQFRPTEQQQHPQQQQPPSSKLDTADDEHSSYDRSGEILPACTGLNRPLNHHEQERISHLDRLKFFLATAPSRWDTDKGTDPSTMSVPSMDPNGLGGSGPASHPALNRFLLPTNESVSCVLWNGLYHITGTDIVRALVFRFEAFGRPVKNMKKFEEGIFSDLRNLKPGVDACLEEPKSPFLDLLFKYQCIRTQKKQKVFYWFSVPHDRLFLDALERDLKREKMGLEPTTVVTGEPALSFTYDPKKSLYEQFSKAQGGKEGEGELEAAVRRANEAAGISMDASADGYVSGEAGSSPEDIAHLEDGIKKSLPPALQGPNTAFSSMFSLFEGSPTYKQRRKKMARASRKTSGDSSRRSASEDYSYAQHRGESIMDIGVGYGPADSGMSAADLFVAQAKGELGSANPDEREKERQRKEARVSPFSAHHSYQGHSISLPQHQMSNPVVSRPLTEPRHNSYPLSNQSHYLQPNLRPHALTFPPPISSNDMTMANVDSSQQKTKVFVCPLYSCCRFFKRMEHLKRHLRTHTLERPYQCQRCKKRFSRSDNLNQHIRTHTRADSEGGGSGYEDDQADIESEGMDELDVEGAYNPRAFPNGVADLQNPDMKMCEVEIPGHVQEIQGDEEGLVSANGQEALVQPQFQQYGNFQFPSVSQWAGGLNPQSPMQQSSGQLSRSNTPGYTMRQSPSAYGGSDSEFVGSISAPSHKQIFDHSALYPPRLMESSGPGPIRRHRSMTPSLIKGETGRRALTSTSSEYGSPGRGYHPYAIPLPPSSYVSASSNSAQSSPASYPMPLDFPSSQAGSISGISRSNSTHRSTSSTGHLQDQMHRILNIDQMDDTTSFHASPNQQTGFDGVYRSESPLAYPSEVLRQDQGLFTADAPVDQFGSHAVDSTYFSGIPQSQPHVSL